MVSETEPCEARHVETVGYPRLAPIYLLFMQRKKEEEKGGRERQEKKGKKEKE